MIMKKIDYDNIDPTKAPFNGEVMFLQDSYCLIVAEAVNYGDDDDPDWQWIDQFNERIYEEDITEATHYYEVGEIILIDH